MLIHGQILRVRARIARQLLLVQLLCRIEHLLRLVPVPLAREHLKCRQRERERRWFFLLLAFVARHLRVLRLRTKRGKCRLRRLFVYKPALGIERRALLRRLPPCTERFARLLVTKYRVEQIICRRLKIFNLALPPHNKRKRRCLDTPDREHEPVMSRTACRERIGTREIHPDEPVRTRPCQC